MRLSSELRDRTKLFAADVIQLYVGLPRQREEVRVLGRQLLRSGTSVAGHAREASRARSDAEFCSKVEGLLQEADETGLWLELLKDTCGIHDERLQYLSVECDEISAIFTTMVSRIRRRM